MPSLDPLPAAAAAPSAPRRKGVPADPQKFAVEVRASRIDGRGAFAGEAVPARRKMMARIMIVEVSDKRAIDASLSSDPLRFTNHSCRPNAVLRIRQGRVEFYAMRDIAPGEELTVNYGQTHHEGKLRCRCGAPGCVGAI
jgi:uncharacterized protein